MIERERVEPPTQREEQQQKIVIVRAEDQIEMVVRGEEMGHLKTPGEEKFILNVVRIAVREQTGQ